MDAHFQFPFFAIMMLQGEQWELGELEFSPHLWLFVYCKRRVMMFLRLFSACWIRHMETTSLQMGWRAHIMLYEEQGFSPDGEFIPIWWGRMLKSSDGKFYVHRLEDRRLRNIKGKGGKMRFCFWSAIHALQNTQPGDWSQSHFGGSCHWEVLIKVCIT